MPHNHQTAGMTERTDPAFVAFGHEGNFENEGRFSHRVTDETGSNADDSIAAPMFQLPQDGGEASLARAPSSLVLIVDRIFRTLGLSPVGTGKKRLLFWFWILWFLVRIIFLIISASSVGTVVNPDTYVCTIRPTIVSQRGYPNRDAQAIINLLDHIGWVLIYFSGLGGRSRSTIIFCTLTPPCCGVILLNRAHTFANFIS